MVSLRAFIVTCVMALGATAVPLNAPRGSPTTWSIQVFIDGPVETFHGDIRDVWKEVLAENPNFEEDFPDYKKQLVGMGYLNSGEIKRSTLSPGSTTDLDDVKSWSIQVFNGGKMEQFEGDIVKVYSEVLEMNPQFEEDFPNYRTQLVKLGWMTEEEAQEAENIAGLKRAA